MKKRNHVWTFIVALLISVGSLSILVDLVLPKSEGANQVFLPIILHPVEHWINAYGNPGSEVVGKMAFATEDGGYILLAEGEATPNTANNGVIAKLASDGTVLWVKLLGLLYSISGHETSDGGLIISGMSWASGTTGAKIMKLTSEGSIVWQRMYGGMYLDGASAIKETIDGGYIYVGTTSPNGISTDLWLVKLDQDGNIIWQQSYSTNLADDGLSIQQTSDGGYIISGSNSDGDWISDLWVLKVSSSGSLIWQSTIGGSGEESGRSILQTNDGGHIVVGLTESVGSGGSDAWVIRLDRHGAVMWQKAYGGTGKDIANSVQATNDEGFVIAGITESFGSGGSDAWVFKLDLQGEIIWQRTFGGVGDDGANSIRQIDNGKYLVAGYTESYGVGDSDAWVLKLSREGDISSCDVIGDSAASIEISTMDGQTNDIQVTTSQAASLSTTVSIVDSSMIVSQLCPTN